MISNKTQLIGHLNQGYKVEYLFFWGHRPPEGGSVGKSCLSQWFASGFFVEEVWYKTAEHYMMAQKARLFGDEWTRARIMECETPNAAQKLGRLVSPFHKKKWEHNREEIVIAGNEAKFRESAGLMDFLLATNDAILVEASPDDQIWGIGLAEGHEHAPLPHKWPGLNLLGFALMEVRRRFATAYGAEWK